MFAQERRFDIIGVGKTSARDACKLCAGRARRQETTAPWANTMGYRGGSDAMDNHERAARLVAVKYFTIWELLERKTREVARAWEKFKNEVGVENKFPRNFGLFLGRLDIDDDLVSITYQRVYQSIMRDLPPTDYVISRHDVSYPERLAQIGEDAPEFLFVRGENLDLLDRPMIAVVGARSASEEGRQRAFKLACLLAERGIAVASGLAKGIDRAAHEGALSVGGDTVAVLGTPLTQVYPKEHKSLQEKIARHGLLVSQFYPGAGVRRYHFPMRNVVMSGLSLGTVVVEASDRSGALIQARSCLAQGRRLFIPQSALDNENLRWPKTFLQRPGAARFSSVDELMEVLREANMIPEKRRQALTPGSHPILEVV